MIQFGDFMAKAALYDHLVQQRGLDQYEALRIISERLVNYNLLAVARATTSSPWA